MHARASLVSYTFNDAALLHGLLRELAAWTRMPDEIVIVDDGSRVPFSPLPEERALPVRIIRHKSNQGFAASKSHGLSAADGDVILSMDCDSRVSSNYLEVCLEHLKTRADVGMVGGPSRYDSGNDFVSRYQKFFGDNYYLELTAPQSVPFIPGHAFAMRRADWHKSGGFNGHERSVCEDHALCAALHRHGLSLLVDPAISIRQIRRLSRFAHCRRLWSWMGPEVSRRLLESATPLQELTLMLIQPLAERLSSIMALNDPALLYVELLAFIDMSLRAVESLPEGSLSQPALLSALTANCLHRLIPCTKLAALLKADILELGWYAPLLRANAKNGKTDDAALWAGTHLAFLGLWDQHGLLHRLETDGMPGILADLRGEHADFSAYNSL